MKFQFPPPLFKSRPLKRDVLVFRPGKGLSIEQREEPIQFPPPLLELDINIGQEKIKKEEDES